MRTITQINILIKSCNLTLEGLLIDNIITQEEYDNYNKSSGGLTK